MSEPAEIRDLTIRAQLAREFADRLDKEADAWLAEATARRARAVEFKMKAEALTQEAGLIRAAQKPGRKRESRCPM